MSDKLSERYQRALDRERVAVSFTKDRAKRIMEQVFKEGRGNTISDRIISVLKAGLEAERQDSKDRKSNFKDYFKGDKMSDKEAIIEFIEEHFEVPEDRELSEEKSLGYLQGYLAIRLQNKNIDIDITEVGDLELSYLEGLIAGTSLKEDVFRKTKSKREDTMDDKIEKLKEARTEIYDGNQELKDMVEALKEDKNMDEISALREARIKYFQEKN